MEYKQNKKGNMRKTNIVKIFFSAAFLFQQAITSAAAPPPIVEPTPLLPPGMPTPAKQITTKVTPTALAPGKNIATEALSAIVAVSPQVTITNLSKQDAIITEITVNYMIVHKAKSNKKTALQSTKSKINLTIKPGAINASSFSPELHISTTEKMDNASIHSWVSKIQIGSEKINIAQPSTFSGQSICINRSNKKWILVTCNKKTGSKSKAVSTSLPTTTIRVPITSNIQVHTKEVVATTPSKPHSTFNKVAVAKNVSSAATKPSTEKLLLQNTGK